MKSVQPWLECCRQPLNFGEFLRVAAEWLAGWLCLFGSYSRPKRSTIRISISDFFSFRNLQFANSAEFTRNRLGMEVK